MSCSVIIPVWNRPERAAPVLVSIADTSDATAVFVVSADDEREQKRLRAGSRCEVIVVDWPGGSPGDYARKVNAGVAATGSEWVFQGADDLRFEPGWLDACLAVHADTGCRVIGTNDQCNPRVMRGQHSTHSLVHRSFIEEIGDGDEPGTLLHEGYWHGFVDDELVTVARMHREFAHAPLAVVRHLHPNCGESDMDATYERALDGTHFRRDRQLYLRRRREMMRRARRSRRRPAAA